MTPRDRRALVEAKICLEFALDISVETVKRGHARDAHAILAVLLERWQRETGFPPPVPGADPDPVQRPPRASGRPQIVNRGAVRDTPCGGFP